MIKKTAVLMRAGLLPAAAVLTLMCSFAARAEEPSAGAKAAATAASEQTPRRRTAATQARSHKMPGGEHAADKGRQQKSVRKICGKFATIPPRRKNCGRGKGRPAAAADNDKPAAPPQRIRLPRQPGKTATDKQAAGTSGGEGQGRRSQRQGEVPSRSCRKRLMPRPEKPASARSRRTLPKAPSRPSDKAARGREAAKDSASDQRTRRRPLPRQSLCQAAGCEGRRKKGDDREKSERQESRGAGLGTKAPEATAALPAASSRLGSRRHRRCGAAACRSRWSPTFVTSCAEAVKGERGGGCRARSVLRWAQRPGDLGVYRRPHRQGQGRGQRDRQGRRLGPFGCRFPRAATGERHPFARGCG